MQSSGLRGSHRGREEVHWPRHAPVSQLVHALRLLVLRGAASPVRGEANCWACWQRARWRQSPAQTHSSRFLCKLWSCDDEDNLERSWGCRCCMALRRLWSLRLPAGHAGSELEGVRALHEI